LVVLTGLFVVRAKEQAPKTKRAGSNLPMSILLSFPKETRGKGIAGLVTAEARLGRRGTTRPADPGFGPGQALEFIVFELE